MAAADSQIEEQDIEGELNEKKHQARQARKQESFEIEIEKARPQGQESSEIEVEITTTAKSAQESDDDADQEKDEDEKDKEGDEKDDDSKKEKEKDQAEDKNQKGQADRGQAGGERGKGGQDQSGQASGERGKGKSKEDKKGKGEEKDDDSKKGKKKDPEEELKEKKKKEKEKREKEKKGKKKKETKKKKFKKTGMLWSRRLLMSSWPLLATPVTFLIGLIYIDFHVFCRAIGATKVFCSLGDEWPGLSKSASKKAGFIEKVVLSLANLIFILFLILALGIFIGAPMLILSIISSPLVMIKMAIGFAVDYVLGLFGF